MEWVEDDDLPLPVKVARGSAFALWSLSKSERNKAVIKKSGGLPLLAGLVRMKQTSILIPVIGTLQECATDQSYRQTMQSECLMEDLVANLRTASPQLKMLCAKAIFRLAEEEESRHLVKVHGGLEPLVELIKENKDNANRDNKLLMAAVTGALWKVSSNAENVDRLEDLGIVPTLIKLLVENSEALDDLQFNPTQIDVLTNVVGALAETAKIQRNRDTINNEDGLAPLIRLIATNHPALLVNVSAALGQCAEDKMSLKVIHDLDGVRLLWSLLKNPSVRVQASAAWALSPCIQNASNSGDMVRGFVGGLELICGLLESNDTEVLAAVCYAIANIAKDKENLAVISDHGVIEKLSNLTQTENDMLRAKLALAIGNCCEWAGNRALFGKSGAVAPLVSYLQSSDLNVHITTTLALFQLSKDPWNCVTMHQHGVVTHLLRLIGKYDLSIRV